MITPNLGLPLLAASQAQKHVTHNDALMQIDALLQLSVIDRDLSEPPTNPSQGDRYIVPASGSGAWTGKADALARWQDGEWVYFRPVEGWRAWVADEQQLVLYKDGAWGPMQRSETLDTLGINATASSQQRLAVAAAESLFTHDGSDHRLFINKAAESSSGTIIFQTAYAGRAEIGLAGQDRLSMKVSSDGDSWRSALVVNGTSGTIHMPHTPQFGIFENLLINPRFSVNQRGFGGGAAPNGSFGYDRWRATTGATQITASGPTVQLNGTVAQVVETAHWAERHFGGQTFTFAVRDLSGGPLTVTLNGVSRSVPAGQGTQAASFTLSEAETGNLRLSLSGSTVSFTNVQLVRGDLPSPWTNRPASIEQALCQRYFQVVTSADYGPMVTAMAQNATRWLAPIALPQTLRADPLVTYSGLSRIYLYSGASSSVSNVSFSSRAGHVVTVAVDIDATVGSGSGMLYAMSPLPRIAMEAELTS